MSMTEKKHSLDWTIEAMQGRIIRHKGKSYWRDAFTAAHCRQCKADVNIVTGNRGWFCPCGAYNTQVWSGNAIFPFDEPKYGPTATQLREAIQYHEQNATKAKTGDDT